MGSMEEDLRHAATCSRDEMLRVRWRGRLCGAHGVVDLRPIQPRDPVHTDFSYRFLRAVSADEAPSLDLADDLEVGALGECSRVFGGLAKHHAAMPCGSRLAVSRLTVLPGPLG